MATCHTGSSGDLKLDLTLWRMHRWKTNVSQVLEIIKQSSTGKLSEWAALHGRDPVITEVVHYFTCLSYHVVELLAMLGNESLGPMAIDEYVSAKGVNTSAIFDYMLAKKSIRFHGPTTAQILRGFRTVELDGRYSFSGDHIEKRFLSCVATNFMAQLSTAPYYDPESEWVWVCRCPRCV